MISFNLKCGNGHAFEGWFSSGADFETQQGRKLVECPHCGDLRIEKALMAPAVSTARRREAALPVMMESERIMGQMRELARKVRASAEDVGDRFAEEARRIHYGETEARGIYGRATPTEARSLAEEGVEFLPLPNLPEDQN
jgi:hypothetical protein